MKFEWDQGKALSNEEKHGISFTEALIIGRSGLGNLLVVSYTEREENHLRIISARRATKYEQKHYEQNH